MRYRNVNCSIAIRDGTALELVSLRAKIAIHLDGTNDVPDNPAPFGLNLSLGAVA